MGISILNGFGTSEKSTTSFVINKYIHEQVDKVQNIT